MAIYVTGDIHGGIDIHKLAKRTLKNDGIIMTEDDYLIILGDFGLPFFDSDMEEKSKTRGEYLYWIKWLREKSYTVLWVDGNHDNHNFWAEQTAVKWHGGSVNIHPDADNVIHLMRGEIYDINGYSFLSMGGATSIDKAYRTPNISWWEAENMSDEEKEHARTNIAAHNNTVDFVLTHTPPQMIYNKIMSDDLITTDYTALFFDEICTSLNYRAWLSGHLHTDREFKDEKIALFYNKVDELNKLCGRNGW